MQAQYMDFVQQRGTWENSPYAETGRTYYSWITMHKSNSNII